MDSVADVEDGKKELLHDVHRFARLGVCLVDSNEGCVVIHNGSELSFVLDVKAKKDIYTVLVDLKKSVSEKSIEAFSQGGDGVLQYQGRLCIPNVDELRNQILIEYHSSWYSIHPIATMMYRDL